MSCARYGIDALPSPAAQYFCPSATTPFGARKTGGFCDIAFGSVFHVASVTKGFTAYGIARLEADGKLSRKDPIRRYVPELVRVADRLIHAPWTMDASAQRAAGCVIGRDYPAPVVDHAVQRARALELYGRATA